MPSAMLFVVSPMYSFLIVSGAPNSFCIITLIPFGPRLPPEVPPSVLRVSQGKRGDPFNVNWPYD